MSEVRLYLPWAGDFSRRATSGDMIPPGDIIPYSVCGKVTLVILHGIGDNIPRWDHIPRLSLSIRV